MYLLTTKSSQWNLFSSCVWKEEVWYGMHWFCPDRQIRYERLV